MKTAPVSRAVSAWGLLGIWLLCLAVVTLRPSSVEGALNLNDFLCFWCSSRPGADKVLNWIMFVPGGFALAEILGVRRSVVNGAGLTILIESAQIAIPGRHPSLFDIIENTTGALTGAWGPRPRSAPLTAAAAPEVPGAMPFEGQVLRSEIHSLPLAFGAQAARSALERRGRPLTGCSGRSRFAGPRHLFWCVG